MSAAFMSDWWQPEYPMVVPRTDQWYARANDAPKPRAQKGPCQTFVFYHTCGCKANMNLVYACSIQGCNHTISDLLVAGLPYACGGGLNARSEACGVEDIAKKEFIREVDSADRLDTFVAFPECTKQDIYALTPTFAGSDSQTWIEEICGLHQQRKAQTSVETPPEETPSAVDPSGVGLARVDSEIQAQDGVEGEKILDGTEQKEEELIGEEPQDEQPQSIEADEELEAEIRLFEVGDAESDDGDSENVESDGEHNVDVFDTEHEVDNDVDNDVHNDEEKDDETATEISDAEYIDAVSDSVESNDILPDNDSENSAESNGENGGNGGEHDVKSNEKENPQKDAEKDGKEYTNISLDSPKVSVVDGVGDAGDSNGQKDIPQCAGTAGGSSYAPNPTMSLIHPADDMTDDFMDFLLSIQEAKPDVKPSIWSCFKLF
ncbi:hypothetical protein F5Y05DRAFT_200426 [Hypoxylon sp. FL0543]|nr:hypothetical protein F5Y05DRAFT_200426 [Hypoxylon sp. FL0543]